MASDIATATANTDPGEAAAAGRPPRPEGAVPAAAPRRIDRYRRRRFSPLTARILAVNILALALLGLGLLYLGKYEASLIDTELAALTTQGEIFAAALGEGAVIDSVTEGEQLIPELGSQMMRRLVEPTRTRARLFDLDGKLLADSRVLRGPGGVVQIRELPPPQDGSVFGSIGDAIYDWIIGRLPRRAGWPEYRESAAPKAADYPEVERALRGDTASQVRRDRNGAGLQLSVAVPIQRYKQVLGAVMLQVGSADLEQAVRAVRLDILKVFLIALTVTVLLSFYLAGTIARPVRRLAAAAERVRRGHGRHLAIPDFSRRGDEIGDLSSSLRDMTHALWLRMDAIEHFAADVAHEIKNPLTSLRSAVETAVRIEDPVKQRRLLGIVLEDVARLDRLISDISDASRLDAELSRLEHTPVALDRMLETLVELHEATESEETPQLHLTLPESGMRGTTLTVPGIEGRLVQVFQNLIANAVSFSPPGGPIMLTVQHEPGAVIVTIDDSGPGIPESKLAAIFERFYSERPAGEKFGTHSGLGLSISKQIIEAHRGVIRAENRRAEDGRVVGARFIVRLPAA
jgi:two-component system, OmpR family, sensor histidine kinase ChvG